MQKESKNGNLGQSQLIHTKHGGAAKGHPTTLVVFSLVLGLDFALVLPSKKRDSKAFNLGAFYSIPYGLGGQGTPGKI